MVSTQNNNDISKDAHVVGKYFLNIIELDEQVIELKEKLLSVPALRSNFNEKELDKILEEEISKLSQKCIRKISDIINKDALSNLRNFFESDNGRIFMDNIPIIAAEFKKIIEEWQKEFVSFLETETARNYWKAQAEKGVNYRDYLLPVDLHLYWR